MPSVAEAGENRRYRANRQRSYEAKKAASPSACLSMRREGGKRLTAYEKATSIRTLAVVWRSRSSHKLREMQERSKALKIFAVAAARKSYRAQKMRRRAIIRNWPKAGARIERKWQPKRSMALAGAGGSARREPSWPHPAGAYPVMRRLYAVMKS